jgi:hypothetical protein
MQTTTPNTPALESISSDLLFLVAGGCHNKRGCCPQPGNTVINAPVTQVMQLPQMPQMPAPQELAPQPPLASGGDAVSTSVSINGQPQA